MKKRTANQFLRIIKKAVASDPGTPVRLDVHATERDAVMAAYETLTAAWRDPAASRAVWGWTLNEQIHRDPDKRDAGFGRVTFFSPSWPRPAKNDPAARAARSAACYSQDEITALFLSNSDALRWDEPFAKKHRERERQCREIASCGGKATAHFKDSEIKAAFTRFKEDHPKRGLWYACEMLVKTGMPLARGDGKTGYKNAHGAYRRLARIAKSEQGMSAQEYFDSDL